MILIDFNPCGIIFMICGINTLYFPVNVDGQFISRNTKQQNLHFGIIADESHAHWELKTEKSIKWRQSNSDSSASLSKNDLADVSQ